MPVAAMREGFSYNLRLPFLRVKYEQAIMSCDQHQNIASL